MNEEIDQFKAIYDLIVTFFVTYSFQLIGALIKSLSRQLYKNYYYCCSCRYLSG